MVSLWMQKNNWLNNLKYNYSVFSTYIFFFIYLHLLYFSIYIYASVVIIWRRILFMNLFLIYIPLFTLFIFHPIFFYLFIIFLFFNIALRSHIFLPLEETRKVCRPLKKKRKSRILMRFFKYFGVLPGLSGRRIQISQLFTSRLFAALSSVHGRIIDKRSVK